MIGTCSIDTTCTIWDVTVRFVLPAALCCARVRYLKMLHTRRKQRRRSSSHMTKKCMILLFPRARTCSPLLARTARSECLICGTLAALCRHCVCLTNLTTSCCRRSLEHSTIMYESENLKPLLRLAWNKQDQNYLATVVMDSPIAYVLDIRCACCVRACCAAGLCHSYIDVSMRSMPSAPVAELNAHAASLNGVQWAPHSSCHLCTAGEDSQALIWDLSSIPKPVEGVFVACVSATWLRSIVGCTWSQTPSWPTAPTAR
jgi:hypothetical protein